MDQRVLIYILYYLLQAMKIPIEIYWNERKVTSGGKPVRTKGERGTCSSSSSSSSSVGPKRLATCLST